MAPLGCSVLLLVVLLSLQLDRVAPFVTSGIHSFASRPCQGQLTGQCGSGLFSRPQHHHQQHPQQHHQQHHYGYSRLRIHQRQQQQRLAAAAAASAAGGEEGGTGGSASNNDRDRSSSSSKGQVAGGSGAGAASQADRPVPARPIDALAEVNLLKGTSQTTKKSLRTVIKFGGSSLATGERLMEVGRLVKYLIAEGQRPTMVCSAMGKTTNNLNNAGRFALEDGRVYIDAIRTLHLGTVDDLELGEHVRADIQGLLDELTGLLTGVTYLRELSARTSDQLVSYGERMSVRMMAAVLNKLGIPAQSFDSWTLGLRCSNEFGNAEILPESYTRIAATMSKLDENMVAVVTGYIGKTEDGYIATLGRGGSDLTATVIGNAIGADEVQVWKDVDGMMTADPRAVPNAVPVPCVSYEEAAELAYFGAKILHPESMRPAMKKGLPVRIKNSYNPSHPGTVIRNERDYGESLVTAISFKEHICLIDIVSTRMLGQYGFLSKVFSIFDQYQLSVDMISTSEVSISLTLDKENNKKKTTGTALAKLRELADVTTHEERAIISLIANVHRSSEVMAEIFSCMVEHGIQVYMLSQGASKVNIGLVVTQQDLKPAMLALHQHFFGTGEALKVKQQQKMAMEEEAAAVL